MGNKFVNNSNRYDPNNILADKYRVFNKIIKKVDKKKYLPFREFLEKLFIQYQVPYDEKGLNRFLKKWYLLEEQYYDIIDQNGKERIYLKFREVKRVPCRRFKEFRMTLEGFEDITLVYYSPSGKNDYIDMYCPNIFDTIIFV